ncbi:MAG TPA: hypothetical protein VGN52_24675 [Burkholderiales bacterium]|jgi:PKHD-type hydroxylase
MFIVENVLWAEELAWVRQFAADNFTGGHYAVSAAARAPQTVTTGGERQLAELVLAALRRNDLFYRITLPLEISRPVIDRTAPDIAGSPQEDTPVFRSLEGRQVRGDLSVMLIVSDPGEYEGGELLEPKSGERFKPAAGSLVVLPGGAQEPAPVMQGERHAIVFWVQSMVRDPEQRAVLTMLDKCIQVVWGRLPDGEEARQLGRVLSSLGRMWINT